MKMKGLTIATMCLLLNCNQAPANVSAQNVSAICDVVGVGAKGDVVQISVDNCTGIPALKSVHFAPEYNSELYYMIGYTAWVNNEKVMFCIKTDVDPANGVGIGYCAQYGAL